MNDEESIKYWLLLNKISGLGSVSLTKLLQHFVSVNAIFKASNEQLLACGLTERVIKAIVCPDWKSIEADLAWLQQPNHYVITCSNEYYPCLLKQIAYFPLILYVFGDVTLLKQAQIAVVGSRKPTEQGRETAFLFANALATADLVVTSGLALGIDAASHRGALAQQGKTIAVVGTGLDIVYPKKHQALAESIVEQGAIVSEFPLGTLPKSENFPRRNRIISGLSLGVLVVEATLHSGSLITARYAGEQGREVFAIPGSIHNPMAKGCHYLLQQGAKLTQSVQDVFEELIGLDSKRAVRNDSQLLTGETSGLDSESQALLACFDEVPSSIDTLMRRSRLTFEQISTKLLYLELQGYIIRDENGYIKKLSI